MWYRFHLTQRDGGAVYLAKNYHGNPPAVGEIVEVEHASERVSGKVMGAPKRSPFAEHGHVGLVSVVELAEIAD